MDSLVEYETAVDASEVDAAATETAETAPEAEATEVVEQAPPNLLEGIDLDAIRALSEVAPSLLNRPAPEEQWQQQREPEGPPEFDMLDPESFAARLDWERQQTLSAIAEMVDPLRQQAAQAAGQEQQALLKDAAHDVEVRKGEFLGDDDARNFAREQMLEVARELIPQFIQRYGKTDRAADLALEAAHERIKGYQDTIAKAAVEQHVNRNTRLAEQHSEPGGSAASGVTVTPPIAAADYRPGMISEKFAVRANALRTG